MAITVENPTEHKRKAVQYQGLRPDETNDSTINLTDRISDSCDRAEREEGMCLANNKAAAVPSPSPAADKAEIPASRPGGVLL